MGDTDKSQFLKAMWVIDKLSPINFSSEDCGKFSMRLTNFFFVRQITQINRLFYCNQYLLEFFTSFSRPTPLRVH